MKIYLTDGSEESFYTAVFDAYRESDSVICSDGNIQLSIDSETVRVAADCKKSERVRRGMAKYDRDAERVISLALRSCERIKEQTAFQYIRTIMEYRSPVRKRLNLPQVSEMNDVVGRVTTETHRFKGFLRFMESAAGTLYAPYAPDNDITDLIMPHFAERFKSERFVIHDTGRKIAGMYNGKEWIVCYAGEAEVYLSEYERAFEALWRKYYRTVNIADRPHEKQMRGYMPARYWKYMPEKKPEDR